MASEPISVLVVYVHALLGRGLEQLLGLEPRLAVHAVPVDADDELEEALRSDTEILIFEDGGSVSLEALLERSRASVVVVTNLVSGHVWTLRRDPPSAATDDVVAGIVETCLAGSGAAGPGREPAMPREPAVARETG